MLWYARTFNDPIYNSETHFYISSGKTLTELTTMFEKKEKHVSNSNQSTYARQYLSKEEEAKNTIRDI